MEISGMAERTTQLIKRNKKHPDPDGYRDREQISTKNQETRTKKRKANNKNQKKEAKF